MEAGGAEDNSFSLDVRTFAFSTLDAGVVNTQKKLVFLSLERNWGYTWSPRRRSKGHCVALFHWVGFLERVLFPKLPLFPLGS